MGRGQDLIRCPAHDDGPLLLAHLHQSFAIFRRQPIRDIAAIGDEAIGRCCDVNANSHVWPFSSTPMVCTTVSPIFSTACEPTGAGMTCPSVRSTSCTVPSALVRRSVAGFRM